MRIVCYSALCSMVMMFYGCGNNPLASPATLSFYSGNSSGNRSSIGKIQRQLPLDQVTIESASMYIDKIEISRTGTKWEEVLSGPYEVKITHNNAPLRFGNPTNIPTGQYEGLRISIQPKVVFKFTDGRSKTVDKLPQGINMYGFNLLASQAIITITTANGLLDAFTIERGAETALVFDIYIGATESAMMGRTVSNPCVENVSDWFLAFNHIGATRFVD